MGLLLKILPILLVIGWIYWQLTAHTRMSKTLRRESKPLQDWQLMERIQSFASALRSKPFEVRVFNLDQVNAMALPDGGIYISTGLYEQYLRGGASRDEVAAVIAHEIGHVALGHGQRRVEVGRAQMALLAMIGFLFGRLLFGWIGILASLGIGVLNSQTSRRQEFEADGFAAQLLMRTGVNPRATITMLEKVEKWGGSAPDQPIPFRWFMTHPPIQERIAWIERVIDAGVPEQGRLAAD